MESYRANGKLLISGEYAVIDEALALAIPTRYGQTLKVNRTKSPNGNPILDWKAYRQDDSLWFSAEYDLKTLELLSFDDQKKAEKLQEILKIIRTLNPSFFGNRKSNLHGQTRLEFPEDWGLGSSSTLIYLLGKWTNTDPFEINRLTFNTSGYDVACAGEDHPILYQNSGTGRRIETINFEPEFSKNLLFIHLNKKQDTQKSVSRNYRKRLKNPEWIKKISAITERLSKVSTLFEFEDLIEEHENLIAFHLGFSKAKDLYFSDYQGSIKSLGAWGGDFVLATRGNKEYFHNKGFRTIIPFDEMRIS